MDTQPGSGTAQILLTCSNNQQYHTFMSARIYLSTMGLSHLNFQYTHRNNTHSCCNWAQMNGMQHTMCHVFMHHRLLCPLFVKVKGLISCLCFPGDGERSLALPLCLSALGFDCAVLPTSMLPVYQRVLLLLDCCYCSVHLSFVPWLMPWKCSPSGESVEEKAVALEPSDCLKNKHKFKVHNGCFSCHFW